MAYTEPTDPITGDLYTAAWHVTDVNDNIRYLKTQADSRQLIIKVIGDGDSLTTGDGKMYLTIPAILNGWNLTAVAACVYTVSSSGTPTVQIHNATDSQDMLSTLITIDASEYSSYTATTPPVIDTTYDDVATGDRLRIDVDVAGTGTKGLEIHLKFQPA